MVSSTLMKSMNSSMKFNREIEEFHTVFEMMTCNFRKKMHVSGVLSDSEILGKVCNLFKKCEIPTKDHQTFGIKIVLINQK